MSVKSAASLFELMEKRYQNEFFNHYASLGNVDSNVPEEIRCKQCNGAGGKKLFASYDSCILCQGTGIPPIPNFEIYGPKRPSKAKK